MSQDSNAIEGVSGASLRGIGGCGASTCIFVVVESAVKFTDDRIEVAIGIYIRQDGGADIPNINAIEGVSGASLFGIGGCGASTCVFVVLECAETFTHDRIEVAIAIEIREGGGACRPNINAIEWGSGASLFYKYIGHKTLIFS